MKEGTWIMECPAAITVCDAEGIIIEMNASSAEMFERDGGRKLLGKNALDCHPEPARSKMVELLQNRVSNCYTIEKDGVKKMVYQAPWSQGGKFGGIVEIVFEIPRELPHFIRKPSSSA